MTDDDTRPLHDPGRPTDDHDEDARKNYSWGRNLPALRLNRPPESERTQRPVSAPAVYRIKPPWYLRPVRLLLGVGLLAGAWGLALLLMTWGYYLLAHLPQTWQAEWTDLAFALNVVGALLLAVATLVIFVVGLFSLVMALTARGW